MFALHSWALAGRMVKNRGKLKKFPFWPDIRGDKMAESGEKVRSQLKKGTSMVSRKEVRKLQQLRPTPA